MQMRVKTNIPDVRRIVGKQRSQVPFATAVALTATAKSAQKRAESLIDERFDKPTPFTKKGVAILPARKSRLMSRVFVKDRQATYLAMQETGGTRTPSGRALVIPANVRRNRYGNIARGGVQRLLARADTFSGRVNGVGGIYQRTKTGGLKLLIAYEQKAEYKPRFDFRKTTADRARRAFPVEFRKAWRRAMATVR